MLVTIECKNRSRRIRRGTKTFFAKNLIFKTKYLGHFDVFFIRQFILCESAPTIPALPQTCVWSASADQKG